MTRQYFDLAGLRLEVTTDAPRILVPLLSLIGEWAVPFDENVAPQCRFSLVHGPVEASSPPADVFFHGMIGDEGPFQLSGNADCWHLLAPDRIRACFDRTNGTVEFTVGPACNGEILSIATSYALDHIVGAAGHVMVHAACIETPDGSGRLVLHAPSGTGKTTTALALVEAGYRLCTDDATILTPTADGQVLVRGVPRPIKVHRKTAGIFPWLGAMIKPENWDENEEQWVARKVLATKGCLAADDARPVISVIALRRSGLPMQLTELNGADAFGEIIADNIDLGAAGLFPGHEERLDIYSRTLASCVCYRLDINGTPDDVAAMIDAALTK
ncbi:hypothetical protein [Hoeflea poritis]|uniref:Serine kinase n=1 Tax=Hoeflea poritis TaxID=2993659 RepID=A0ABT4VQ50_9HYPH|nr:hypothetical protein [Hoeflea poritis]MDA4846202.1 hypothetical protein [Hoeflea poritis]